MAKVLMRHRARWRAFFVGAAVCLTGAVFAGCAIAPAANPAAQHPAGGVQAGNIAAEAQPTVPAPATSATGTPKDSDAATAPPSATSAPAPGAPAIPAAAAPPAVVPDFTLPPIVDGMVPVLTRIPTTQPVVFLTIDDGANKTPEQVELLKSHGIKASLFLARTFIADNPGYFKQLQENGSVIEDHSISHPLNLIQMSYEQQRAEICQMADYAQQQYGRRPVFFRPPGGPYTNVTRKAAADCGMRAIVDWFAKANAGRMDYQQGQSLQPGDIVLMHFRPEFAADLQAFVSAQQAAGLRVVLLEDFLATG